MERLIKAGLLALALVLPATVKAGEPDKFGAPALVPEPGSLGLLMVGFAGYLLGNYISQPVSELEDGLLAIINGQQDLRFQIEHDELGGLVFRINSLLNAMTGSEVGVRDRLFHTLDPTTRELRLSGRAHDRALRLARTVADLAGAERIGEGEMAQAMQLRRREQV